MKLITLTVCFNQSIIFDPIGIKAYNEKHEKISFNVEELDHHYIITEGEDYYYYEWTDQMVVTDMSLYGHGIFHIKMNLDLNCNIKQHDCTCHLYHLKLQQCFVVSIMNGILIGDAVIKQFHLNAQNSIVKYFKIASDVHVNCKNTLLFIDTLLFVSKKLNFDSDSLIMVNNQQINYNNGHLFSYL